MFSIHGMNTRQLLILCICLSLITFQGTVAVGLTPVYAVRLGANSTMTGVFLAFGFTTVALGNIFGGWLADRLRMYKLILLISYVAWIPATLLITQANDINALILLNGLQWLPGGVAIAVLNIITGLSASKSERGKVFGWTALATGVGGLLAGAVGGPIAERWGFPTLFVGMAVTTALMLVIATFIHEPTQQEALGEQVEARLPNKQHLSVGHLFYLVILANLLVSLGLFAGGLGSPLAMIQLGFDAAGVSSVIAVSSAITLPLPLILGWLSDRAGRKFFMIICYVIGVLGLLLLVPAMLLWQFWLSACLMAVAGASRGVAQAFVADLVPPQAMGRSISLFTTTSMLAGILGNSGAGYVMDAIGIRPALLISAGLLLLAIGLLLPLRQSVSNPIAFTKVP